MERNFVRNNNEINAYYNNEEFELELEGFPKGSDLTIINTAYSPKTKDEDDKYHQDFIAITFKDNTTGLKHTQIIFEPMYTFYMLNPDEKKIGHNLFFIEKERVIPVTCKYSNLLKVIAKLTGNEEFYYDNITNRNSYANRRLHLIPEVFMSDMNVENYYRFLFSKSYTNNPIKLKKSYLDIEVDGRYSLRDFPEPGEVPINAISFLDDNSNTSYQFLYNDKRNPLINMYKASFKNPAEMKKLKAFIINAVGGYKKAVEFGVDKLEYRIYFFDDEIDLIKTTFDVIHHCCPDVLFIWNMAFDLNYIAKRIENLGIDVLDILSDPNMTQKYYKFYIDERNKNDFEERGDFVHLSDYTVWLDQMIQFASRRKGRGRYQSFSLDAIGEQVAGVKKLDYSHITNDISMLPYLNFEIFSFYNIMDTIVQKCIETKTSDADYIFTKCLVNNTIYPKGHRQSTYLTNRFTKDFYKDGYIIGNNRNIFNEKPAVKFPGAMVGDPLHNGKSCFVHINGRPTLIVSNSVDFDYSALYPSIILENNLAPNTQIGALDIPDPVHDMEHRDMYSSDDDEARYMRGGEFLENMMCDNVLEFCRRWMHLGDIHDTIKDMEEFFKYNGYHGRPMDYDIKSAFFNSKDKLVEGISETPYRQKAGIIFTDTLSEDYKLELIDQVKKSATL